MSADATDHRPSFRQRHRSLQRAFNHVVYLLAVGLIGLMRALLRLVPTRAAPAIGRPLGRLAAAVAATERRRAEDNVARVWPGLSASTRRAIVRQSFVNLGRSAMECLVLDRVLAAGACRFGDGAAEAISRARAGGRGVIFATAHFGNWELMAAAVAQLAPVYVLARRSYDPRFTRLIERFRRRSGIRCIWVERRLHLRQAVRALRGNAVVGILVDQPVRSGRQAPFLGQPAPTTEAVAALARLTGAPVLTGFIERQGPSQHQIVIRSCDVGRVGRGSASLASATAHVSAKVEAVVRTRPDLWLWTLDRWRFASADANRRRAAQVPTKQALLAAELR